MASLPATHVQVDMGRRLQRLRDAVGLSQPAFAELLGVAPNTVSSYETGRTRIDVLALARLCEQLQISADYILSGAIGRLPFDIAARIQQADRASLGDVIKPGRPRKHRAPTVDEVAPTPPVTRPAGTTLHEAPPPFIHRPKSQGV